MRGIKREFRRTWVGFATAALFPALIFVATYACHYATTLAVLLVHGRVASAGLPFGPDRPPGISAYDALPRVRFPQLREPFSDWMTSFLPEAWRQSEFEGDALRWRVLLVSAAVWTIGLALLSVMWWTWTLVRHRDEAPGVLWKTGQWRGVAVRSCGSASAHAAVRVSLIVLLLGSLAEVVVPPFVSIEAVYSMRWHDWIQWVGAIITPSIFLRCLTQSAAAHTAAALAGTHCERCGYSLEGIAHRVCPECGEQPTRRERSFKWLSTKVLAIAAAGACLIVSAVWWGSGSYVPDLLFRVVPLRAMDADVRDYGRGAGRPVHLEMNSWSLLIPSYEGLDLSGHLVLVRVDREDSSGDRTTKARVRCVFGYPDEGFVRWRNRGYQPPRPTLEESFASGTLYAWSGEIVEGSPTTALIGTQRVNAGLEHGKGWHGASTVVLTMHRSMQSGGANTLRVDIPLSDVMDALDWAAFERQTNKDDATPVGNVPRLPSRP